MKGRDRTQTAGTSMKVSTRSPCKWCPNLPWLIESQNKIYSQRTSPTLVRTTGLRQPCPASSFLVSLEAQPHFLPPRHTFRVRVDRGSPLARCAEGMGRQASPTDCRIGPRLQLHRPKWPPDGFPDFLSAHSGSPRRRIPIRDRRGRQVRLVFRRLRHGSKRVEETPPVDQRCVWRSTAGL